MIKREPQTAKIRQGKEAWWYENKNSIDVVIQGKDSAIVMCRIPRRKLADWIKRSGP